ncbi:hypothetical protein LIA77_00546 [Sarocladium implicatum]|nr:hypothetical protein LIA77_00546 [Sarocladium implicatum]
MRKQGMPYKAGLALLLGCGITTSFEIRQRARHQGADDENMAYITAPPALRAREENKVCGTGLRMCPSSASGGCCPDKYSCGTDSCYATSTEPSTCGTLVGWRPCANVYGGGCCPDGWACETADRCIPPSGSAYTFGCPTSQFLCPSSEGYGCCPNGMACGQNKCYSTEASTITSLVQVTTTRNGEETVITSTSITTSSPTRPTDVRTVNAQDADDQAVFKYFPSAIEKVSPTVEPEDDEDDGGGGGGGLSKAQLGGIVAGAVVFLIIVLVAAFFIIRKLNTAVAAFSNSNISKQSDGSNPRPAMRQYRPTDSEIDTLSVDPLMMSPQPSYVRHDSSDAQNFFGQSSPDPTSTNPTPSSFAGAYQQATPSASRHTSFDAAGNAVGYFEPVASRSMRVSQGSSITPPNYRVSADSQQTAAYTHVRNWSNASDSPDDVIATESGNGVMAGELEGSPYVAELVGSPTTTSTQEERRRSSGSGTGMMAMTRPSLSQQRRRSDGRSPSRTEATPPPNMLGVVSEEIHGFHGPTDRMAGQTAHRPSTRGAQSHLGDEPLPESSAQG